MSKTKEIVIISGKGGTGKTTVTASLALLIADKILVDADVDAANLFLLMKPDTIDRQEFAGKPIARIDSSLCTVCNICRELCRFDAIRVLNNEYQVDEISCDGCGLCKTACPKEAIDMVDQMAGHWMESGSIHGDFFHARLKPGGENSGHLVTLVKKLARLRAEEKDIDTILIDGPPGIGCPVIAAITGSTYAVLVTEPSHSGITDLKRILELVRHFKIPCGMVINKHDINPDNTRLIEQLANQKKLDVLARIPHNFCVIEEISRQNIPLHFCPEFKVAIERIYDKINKYL